MSTRRRGMGAATVLCLFVAACQQPEVDSGPTYADLVVIYNAELEALDRLEAKRDKLIEEYAAASAPDKSGDTLTQLEGLLKSASDLNKEVEADEASDPNALLDDLADRNGDAKDLVGQLLDGLTSEDSDAAKSDPTPEEAAAIAERKATFEAELAQLDSEIAKQKERVERARKARDAAESKAESAK